MGTRSALTTASFSAPSASDVERKLFRQSVRNGNLPPWVSWFCGGGLRGHDPEGELVMKSCFSLAAQEVSPAVWPFVEKDQSVIVRWAEAGFRKSPFDQIRFCKPADSQTWHRFTRLKVLIWSWYALEQFVDCPMTVAGGTVGKECSITGPASLSRSLCVPTARPVDGSQLPSPWQLYSLLQLNSLRKTSSSRHILGHFVLNSPRL